MKKNTLIILFIAIYNIILSQTGQPFIRNFSPYEFDGEGQIWTIVQDSRGIMYFGGNQCIHEYDGVTWKKISLNTENLSVRSLAIDNNGRIYVGSVGEMGYLEPDETGDLKYISIVEELDTAYRKFTDIWTIACSGANVYFCSNEFLFRYNPDANPKFYVIKEGLPYFLAYKVRDEIFVSIRDKGIFKIEGDSLITLPAQDKVYPWIMLPYEEDKYLIGMRGLWIWDPNSKDTAKCFTKDFFNQTELEKTEKFLQENQLYLGAAYLGNNLYALSTIRSGVVIIDNKGKIVNVIDKQHNLLSQTVHYLYKDNNSQLWAGLTYGISYIETNSPFEYFDAKMGIEGSIYYAFRTNDNLYSTSNLGIFYWENNKFNNVPELSGTNALQIFNPVSFKIQNEKNYLTFVTTVQGMYKIEGKNAVNVNNHVPSSYVQSKFDSSVVFISEDYYIYKGSIKDNLSNTELIGDFDFFPLILGDKDKNSLWILNENKPCIYNIETKETFTFENNQEIKDIDFNDGFYFESNDNMVFLTSKGFYSFDDNTKKFIDINHSFNFEFKDKNIIQFDKVSDNKIWINIRKNDKTLLAILTKNADTFTIDTIPFSRLFEIDLYNNEGDSIMWIISPNALFKFKANYKKDYSVKNQVLIRKIIAGDSTYFNGCFFDKTANKINISLVQNPEFDFIFKYKNNDLRIEFALPEYDNSVENEYSYLLVGGKNKEWSDWSNATYKELSNLNEGRYVFQVKAKNIYGFESKIAEVEFRILPPWYRTIFAYIFYIIVSIVIIWLIVRIYSQKLKRENERLDRIVKERTAEINQQNEEIKTQAENLFEMNKLLTEKNEEINQQNEEIIAFADSLQEANNKIKEKNIYITDSINYAKRIQEAVLPASNKVKELLPEHFILFNPKDIISGDFYWIKKIKNNLLVVVADCTGHGVPGGFIAMLGISVLNEIVRHENIKKPAEALEAMRAIVKSALKQNKSLESQDDGMDMGFVAIDTETNELTFSGAFIPLYLVRNKEIITFNAVLNPIGIYPFEKPFENETYLLQKNDMLYMTSDGYKDQLNIQNKQFSTNKFIEIIEKIAATSMTNQKQTLLEEFLYWSKGKDQTDDVLVLGFRWLF